MEGLLSWQNRQWTHVMNMVQRARLPHALLFRGPPWVGIHSFAERLVTALLCTSDDVSSIPCGGCRGCRLSAAGTHPDLTTVVPREGKKNIGIDPIRALIAAIGLTPTYAGHKVAMLSPAEQLTREAANSLLKTLEEPPGNSVFLLISNASALLPATVRSRCHIIDFPIPPRQPAHDWLTARLPGDADTALLLDIAGGAPLAAFDLHDEATMRTRTQMFEDLSALVQGQADAMAAAKRWRASGSSVVTRWIVSFTQDLIRLKFADQPPTLINRDVCGPMRDLKPMLDLRQLYALLDLCRQVQEEARGKTGLNEQLLLEEIAVGYASLGGRQ